MFNKIKDIQIKGGCYNEGTVLQEILSQRLNIVYGRNGSGKSSLAKAIYDYAHDEQNKTFEIAFSPELTEEAKSRIFVYSEDFVIDNVKLAKDGLNQIVMIGEQVDFSDKEDELKKELFSIAEKLSGQKDLLESKNESISKAEKKLLVTIKGDYAKREKEFRNLNRNPNVNLETIKDIYNLKNQATSYNIYNLVTDMENGTKIMRGTVDVQKVIWNTPSCTAPDILDECSSILERKIQQVELNDRDKLLISILADSELSHYANNAKSVLIDRHATVCPLCMQPLSTHTLTDLEEQIKRVLNKDVENYQSEITRATCLLHDIDDTAPAFPIDKYDNDINLFKKAVADVNRTLEEIRQRLHLKSNNPFNSEKPLDLDSIRNIYNSCSKSCQKLLSDIDEFNKNLDERKTLENDLKKKNQILAYLENKADFDTYFENLSAIEILKTDIKNQERKQKETENQLRDIESRRNQTKIAIDFINTCLASVFFDKNRLLLEDAGGKFILKSRGNPVSPYSVSTGERNIIGLAYFFASIFENTSQSNRYNNPFLIVIDDPITSFDQDNRLGVMALLKEQLTKLLVKNDDSKVLVMSHDQRTIDMLVSLNSSIENYIKHKSGQTGHDDCYIYELHKRARRKTNSKTKNEYSQMLAFLYSFACDKEPEKIEYVGIGNTIRRVLESFSLMTFNTADYVRAVDNNYLNLKAPYNYEIGDAKEIFRKMLTRIVLNAESHSSTQLDQNSYDSTFTRENIQVLAKYALIFIMCINERHLYTSLESGWKNIVTEWYKELICDKQRSGTVRNQNF